MSPTLARHDAAQQQEHDLRLRLFLMTMTTVATNSHYTADHPPPHHYSSPHHPGVSSPLDPLAQRIQSSAWRGGGESPPNVAGQDAAGAGVVIHGSAGDDGPPPAASSPAWSVPTLPPSLQQSPVRPNLNTAQENRPVYEVSSEEEAFGYRAGLGFAEVVDQFVPNQVVLNEGTNWSGRS